MGSLPDLTERARPAAPRPAARTVSDPHRHRLQQPVPIVAVKEWRWKRPCRISRAPAPMPVAPRRKDSASSSVGAASVRRLLRRAPPRPTHAVVPRFAALCVARALSSAALLPLTAVAGAENASPALALMHTVAAVMAPCSPILLKKIGARAVISIAHALICLLLSAHAAGAPELVLIPLFAAAGLVLAPLSLAHTTAATATAHSLAIGSRDDEGRRRVVLRRALRALRAAQDAGLLAGALLLGGGATLWPTANLPSASVSIVLPTNRSAARWPPPEDYFQEDDYEERVCGASGCPDDETSIPLNAMCRRALFSTWAALALAAVLFGAVGATGAPPPPPAELAAPSRASLRDPRLVLAAPMALFIGLQEGFIYTSYTKWYAVCIGGWGAAWIALAGAGALQAVAAATLSMAAARGRRGALAAGGAAAHACLLLALLRWRAARTDQALPAVAAAAWGACGALWDTLQAGSGVGGAGWRASWSLILAARHTGMAAACAARQLLCVRTQLATLAVSLALAISTHAAKEIRARRAAAAAEQRQTRAPT